MFRGEICGGTLLDYARGEKATKKNGQKSRRREKKPLKGTPSPKEDGKKGRPSALGRGGLPDHGRRPGKKVRS